MADDARRSVNREHLLAWCGGLFAVLGLVMAAAGLYGTFAYAVIRRRLELGIRAAVGANPSRLRLLVLRDGALVLAGGIAAGLLGVAGSSRVLGSLLVNVVPGDTVALTTTLSALAAVVAPAIWLPARRAAAIDPATALRHD
jgi:ABC-type antimicrobial peptide transport system permease subunit